MEVVGQFAIGADQEQRGLSPRVAKGRFAQHLPWKLVPQGEYGGGWGLECGSEDDDQLESLGRHR